MTVNDLVNQAVLSGFVGGHEEVAFGVFGDALNWLTSVFSEKIIESLLVIQNFPRLNLDVSGLALCAAQRLVNHNPRMR